MRAPERSSRGQSHNAAMNHLIRFERHRQSTIDNRGKLKVTYLDTATTTCACNLNTGIVPVREALRVAEEHADAVGLPDPLRWLRHFLLKG